MCDSIWRLFDHFLLLHCFFFATCFYNTFYFLSHLQSGPWDVGGMIEIKFIFCLEWKVYVDSMCRGDLEEVCVIPFQYHKNVPAELDTWHRHDLVWNIVHSKSIWVALECSIDIHLDGDHICDQKKKKKHCSCRSLLDR